MARKRRRLEYEEPVTSVELTNRLGGISGRRLRRRIERSGHVPPEVEVEIKSKARVEQATGFLAEALGLSIDEARDVLIQDAAARGLTLGEAAERLLDREDEGDLTT